MSCSRVAASRGRTVFSRPNEAGRLGRGDLRTSKIRIDKNICQCSYPPMLAVEVIDSPSAAIVALDPARSRLLAELSEPASAATLAARLGVARQKLNYHLRALEAQGLVHVADTRNWGGL